jgi:hypothetical protein
VDVRRTQPEGEEYCAFGDLFCDELVGHVSCSALDTICLDHQQISVSRVFPCVVQAMNALDYVSLPFLFTINSPTRHSSKHLSKQPSKKRD